MKYDQYAKHYQVEQKTKEAGHTNKDTLIYVSELTGAIIFVGVFYILVIAIMSL
jgi:hypothetical protein